MVRLSVCAVGDQPAMLVAALLLAPCRAPGRAVSAVPGCDESALGVQPTTFSVLALPGDT